MKILGLWSQQAKGHKHGIERRKPPMKISNRETSSKADPQKPPEPEVLEIPDAKIATLLAPLHAPTLLAQNPSIRNDSSALSRVSSWRGERKSKHVYYSKMNFLLMYSHDTPLMLTVLMLYYGVPKMHHQTVQNMSE